MKYQTLKTDAGDLFYTCVTEDWVFLTTHNNQPLYLQYRNENYGINAHATLKNDQWEISLDTYGVHRPNHKESSPTCRKFFRNTLKKAVENHDWGQQLKVAGIQYRNDKIERLKTEQKELQDKIAEIEIEIVTLQQEITKFKDEKYE